MTKTRDEYIKYRFKRAQESFDDALIMIDNKRWNAAINRLYYSCFYAVTALLLTKGFDPGTHDGARINFSNEFIKTKTIDLKYGKLYTMLSDYRHKGDYGDLFDFNDTVVLPLVDQVKDFIVEIQRLIQK